MANRPLPVPSTRKPLPRVDPFKDPASYAQILAEIYHAEQAALHGFVALGDPTFVKHSEIFQKARNLLLRDERAHILDLEELLRKLGYDAVPPPCKESQKLWDAHRGFGDYPLPLKASLAALICLFTEGLGYAFLYNLAHSTTNEEIKAALMRNVIDEQGHLRVSMNVLKQALELEGARVLTSFTLQTVQFAFEVADPSRAQKALLEKVGFDFYDVAAGSMRFVRDLFVMVLEDAGMNLSPWERRALDWWAGRLFSPATLKLYLAAMKLPEPPWMRPAIKAWGSFENWFDRMRSEAHHG